MIDIGRARGMMESHGLDALLAFSPENVHYATGHSSLPALLVRQFMRGGLILPDSEAPILFTHALEGQEILRSRIKAELVFYGRFYTEPKEGAPLAGEYEDLVSAVAGELKRRTTGSGRIAIEEDYVPHSVYERLKKMMPDASFVDGSGIFRELRKIKSDVEISRIVKAVEICESALDMALKALAGGASELEMASIFRQGVVAQEADPRFVFIGAGEMGWIPLIAHSDYIPRKGDIVSFDVGVSYQGYNSDLARTVVLGRPSTEQNRIYRALSKAQERAIAKVTPGVGCSEVFHEALKAVREAGYPGYSRNHVGHSIGLEVEEAPFLSDGREILNEKMVVAVEVPYYVEGIGGFRIEDDLLIERDGPKLLSTHGSELIEI